MLQSFNTVWHQKEHPACNNMSDDVLALSGAPSPK